MFRAAHLCSARFGYLHRTRSSSLRGFIREFRELREGGGGFVGEGFGAASRQ